MPKKRKNDLSDFQEWLINDQARKTNCSVYASTEKDPWGYAPNYHGLTDTCKTLCRPGKTMRTQRGAIRLLFQVSGHKDGRGYVTLPEPTERSRKAPEASYDIPNYILYCVSNIRRECRFPWEAPLSVETQRLRQSKESIVLRHHPSRGKVNSYRISSEYIDPILNGATPYKTTPLYRFTRCAYVLRTVTYCPPEEIDERGDGRRTIKTTGNLTSSNRLSIISTTTLRNLSIPSTLSEATQATHCSHCKENLPSQSSIGVVCDTVCQA